MIIRNSLRLLLNNVSEGAFLRVYWVVHGVGTSYRSSYVSQRI